MISRALRYSATLLSFLAFFTIAISAQPGQGIQDPVSFSTKIKYIDHELADILFTAVIDDEWHIFSAFNPPGGSNPSEFTFEKSPDYTLVGKVREWPKPDVKYDDIFMKDEWIFHGKAVFTQRIKRLSDKDFRVVVEYEGQACISQCILVSEDFDLTVKGREPAPEGEAVIGTGEGDMTEDTAVTAVPDDVDSLTAAVTSAEGDGPIPDSVITGEAGKDENKKSLLLTFLLAFGIGLITLITPCVFPVIPMTVSFFMHGSENKRKARAQAGFYGMSIVLIYTIPILILTLITAFLGANIVPADIANTMSTHWLPNVIFFLIFIIFAISFFGAFEIVLPSSLVNKADKQADRGGYIGAFFMALTLVIVSFSCTGPLVGSIIVQSLGGLSVDPNRTYSFGELIVQYGEPTIGMLGFSLGVAVPFTIFALFPGLLSNMPKSGGWLNSVKVVLGFIELALAFKFLSVSDQAYHWGLLDREVYIAIWIILSILMGMYLLGKLKFRHDSEMSYLGTGRLGLAIFSFVFALYLFPGMFGAPLKALSGYLPPMHSHDFDLVGIIRSNSGGGGQAEDGNELCDKPKYSDFLHLPHGLQGYYDYEQGLACAKEQNKPIFIDFTGHGCVNCREMEANVWSDPRVLNRLQKDFLIITLYVDDKTKLPEDEWYISEYDNKTKKTVGKKYADFQISKFGVNAQPYYVLLDHDGNILTSKNRAYDKDVDAFLEWMDEGLAEFKKRTRDSIP